MCDRVVNWGVAWSCGVVNSDWSMVASCGIAWCGAVVRRTMLAATARCASPVCDACGGRSHRSIVGVVERSYAL